MSRLFNDASNQFLHVNQAVAGIPFAMVCWFNSNDTSIYHAPMSIGDKDNNDNAFMMRLYPVGGAQKISATVWNNPNSGVALTSTGYTVNTWHHGCVIYVSATDRRAFIDGGSKGTNATSVTPINSDRTTVGAEARSTPFYPVSGMLAEVAIWDLSDWPGATDALKADAFEKILPSLANGDTPENYP
ncbi:hypothetical protein LCGC14_1525090, partial [marine sediment metagenome]